MRKFFSLIALSSMMVTAATRGENILRVGIPTPVTTLDPVKTWYFFHYLPLAAIYQRLVAVDENERIVSALAKRWSVSQNGSVYTFELNEAAHFDDGSPVKSRDVAFSFARILSPNSNSVIRGTLLDIIKGARSLKGAETPSGLVIKSDYKFELHLVHPYSPLLYILSQPGFSIVPFEATFSQKSQGSGPMTGELQSAGQKLLLRFKQIPHEKNDLDGFEVGENPRDLSQALREKSYDVLLGLPLSSLMQAEIPSEYEISTMKKLAYLHLFYNPKSDDLKSLANRQSLGRLLQGAVQKMDLPKTFARQIANYFPEGILPNSYYRKLGHFLSPEEFKKSKAKSFLSKTPLRIVLRKEYYGDLMSEKLSSYLKAAGLNVTIDSVNAVDFLKRLKESSYEAIMGAYISSFPDPDGLLEPLDAQNPIAYLKFPTEALMKQFAKARVVANNLDRLNSYARVTHAFEDRWEFVPLFQLDLPIVHKKDIVIPDSNFRYEFEIWKLRRRGTP